LPGRHITDCQTRLYMKSRQSNVPAIAAAKAGFSTATAYRIEAQQSAKARHLHAAAQFRGGFGSTTFGWRSVHAASSSAPAAADRPQVAANFIPLREGRSSKMATARMLGALSSIGTTSLSHTPASGSGRQP
jgi:hypothetical protein